MSIVYTQFSKLLPANAPAFRIDVARGFSAIPQLHRSLAFLFSFHAPTPCRAPPLLNSRPWRPLSFFAPELLEPSLKPSHASPDASTLSQPVLQMITIRQRRMTASPTSARSISDTAVPVQSGPTCSIWQACNRFIPEWPPHPPTLWRPAFGP